VAGVFLTAAGALLLWRMLRYRLRSRHRTQRFVDTVEAGRNDEGADSSTQ